MSYATLDHAAWVETNNGYINQGGRNRKGFKPLPESLTSFQAKVIDICGMVGGGIYNSPINWEKVNWGVGAWEGHGRMIVPWRDPSMATFDSYQLTMLVLLCHEARIRGGIRTKGFNQLELTFHERSHDGNGMMRHPSLDEAVASFRDYLPDDHRIRYRMPAEEVAA